jgi:RNA polymerase sigma-70 factor (ECF subfamily)
MSEPNYLAERFEENRSHLRGVAYRMLGSASEADDAVQEAWLRLSRTDATGIDNLGGWLTTVVARVCLDMLRSRKSRREDAFTPETPEPVATGRSGSPEREAVLADSVGLALLVVLDRLTPAERLAFVLHDMFGMAFDEIAPIVGRSETATRQLASRARRRVRGGEATVKPDLVRQREVVDAFLAALRGGDFEGLLAVLDPDLVVRSDGAVRAGVPPTEIRGAAVWAKGAVAYGHMAKLARLALVDGGVGLVMAPQGKLLRALRFSFANGKITGIEVIGDPARLGALDLSVVE